MKDTLSALLILIIIAIISIVIFIAAINLSLSKIEKERIEECSQNCEKLDMEHFRTTLFSCYCLKEKKSIRIY